jgi:protein-disulfide isomerase
MCFVCAAVFAGPADGPAGVAAAVGGLSITVADVDEAAVSRVKSLKAQEYQIRRDILERQIEKLLLKTEANRLGITVDDLIRVEILGKIVLPTEIEAKAVIEANPDRYQNLDEHTAVVRADGQLRQARYARRRLAFMADLRARSGVKVYLCPPKLDITQLAAKPSRGPDVAPITILEISDFECPYCNEMQPTLRRLYEENPGKIRHVFYNLPLPSHAHAEKAAEAALCAGDQGAFWKMHDLLFKNQNALGIDELKRYAASLGIEAGQFGSCLDLGKYSVTIKREASEVSAWGVTGTPAFFVNGRRINGAVPYDKLATLIEQELSTTSCRANEEPATPSR